jgi:hypothetical protein
MPPPVYQGFILGACPSGIHSGVPPVREGSVLEPTPSVRFLFCQPARQGFLLEPCPSVFFSAAPSLGESFWNPRGPSGFHSGDPPRLSGFYIGGFSVRELFLSPPACQGFILEPTLSIRFYSGDFPVVDLFGRPVREWFLRCCSTVIIEHCMTKLLWYCDSIHSNQNTILPWWSILYGIMVMLHGIT